MPRKQRHTAKRIYERLRDEHGYPGSASRAVKMSLQSGLSGMVFAKKMLPSEYSTDYQGRDAD